MPHLIPVLYTADDSVSLPFACSIHILDPVWTQLHGTDLGGSLVSLSLGVLLGHHFTYLSN